LAAPRRSRPPLRQRLSRLLWKLAALMLSQRIGNVLATIHPHQRSRLRWLRVGLVPPRLLPHRWPSLLSAVAVVSSVVALAAWSSPHHPYLRQPRSHWLQMLHLRRQRLHWVPWLGATRLRVGSTSWIGSCESARTRRTCAPAGATSSTTATAAHLALGL
jgi:hypothetical protein